MYNYLPVTFSHHLCAFKNTNSPIFFFFFILLNEPTFVRTYQEADISLTYAKKLETGSRKFTRITMQV